METLEQDIFDKVLRWKCETHKIGEWTTEKEVRKDMDPGNHDRNGGHCDEKG